MDCVFEGPIKVAVFYGNAPDGHRCDGKVNVIQSNDFSRASFGDVVFRGRVDLSAQRWPDGLDLTKLVDEL